MLDAIVHREATSDITARLGPTLRLMRRWGYVPTVASLAANLIGGAVAPEDLIGAVDASDDVHAEGDFVCLRGDEPLLETSRWRVESNRTLNGHARLLAQAYARDLARTCPFVESIALAGSVASGGYRQGDDIDFDLLVRAGTKYTSYLLATLLGLRYAWRHRHIEADPLHRTPVLPKLTCINVVWPADQVRPFARQDVGLAFELLRCEPLFGADRFQAVLRDNPWVFEHFPQLEGRVWATEAAPTLNALGSLLRSLAAHPRALRAMERVSRRLAWVLYSFVQWTRSGDPAAAARMEFLRRVKYPYEVFQD